MLLNNCQGLSKVTQKLEAQFQVYLRLCVLLYADDTVLLSDTVNDLQHQLNVFHEYSKLWHLKVNEEKTKIIVFGNGRLPNETRFVYNNNPIEIVNNFKYLGVHFTGKGFSQFNIKQLYDKGIKAMYGAIAKCREHNLSMECKFDIFDKAIKPVILYGCEVWGFCNYKLLEQLHLKFCKHVLGLKSSTPNFMVYGELGRFPINIDVKVRMVGYWAKVIDRSKNKLSNTMYNILSNFNTPWLTYIKNIFIECNLINIFEDKLFPSMEWLKINVSNILKDNFIYNWQNDVFNSPKGSNYRLFKYDFIFENYLHELPPKHSKIFCKFRTCNFKLPIETGRWEDIPREERKCNICNFNEIGDEYHYLFNCRDTTIQANRKKIPTKILL